MTAIRTPEMLRFEIANRGIMQPSCAYCGEPLRAPCVLFLDVSLDPGRAILFHPECAKMIAETLTKEAKEVEALGESTCGGG